MNEQLEAFIYKIKMKNAYKPKLSDTHRAELKALFRENTLKLQDLIQKDLSAWL